MDESRKEGVEKNTLSCGVKKSSDKRLWEAAEWTDGREQRRFNKVLWLNDIIFTVWPPVFCLFS